jgi:hypothetical protein
VDDIFDPTAYLNWDDDDPMKVLTALEREGVLAVDHLKDADSWVGLLDAISKLDLPTTRNALSTAITAIKRLGMTDPEFEAWLMKDLPRKDDPPGAAGAGQP